MFEISAKDLKTFAAGVRYEIAICKAVRDEPSTSDIEFELVRKKLDYLPLIEGTALALADRVAKIEALETHYSNRRMLGDLFQTK